ncbi:hypothetical protein HHI36_018006 [Cryptolaemus montrouzieri]
MVKQIYLELSEVKRYWNVEYFFHDGHRKIYLSARTKKEDKPSLFIPTHVSDSLNFMEMQKLLTLNEQKEFHGIFLAIINPDSTCVYYQISEGLIEPEQITSKHLMKNKQEYLDSQLRKHRNLFEQSALYGIPITLNAEKRDEASGGRSEDVK